MSSKKKLGLLSDEKPKMVSCHLTLEAHEYLKIIQKQIYEKIRVELPYSKITELCVSYASKADAKELLSIFLD